MQLKARFRRFCHGLDIRNILAGCQAVTIWGPDHQHGYVLKFLGCTCGKVFYDGRG